MQVKEADFWTRRLRPMLVYACRKAKLNYTFERVENSVGTGTPDVDYCVESAHGKIELKYSPTDRKRGTSMVLGQGNGLRRSQVIWAVRRLVAGGRVFMVIGTPSRVWLLDLVTYTPREMYAIETYSRDKLDNVATWSNLTGTPEDFIGALMSDRQLYCVNRPTRKESR